MKINVEIDLDPSELPYAKDFLSTFRALFDIVNVKVAAPLASQTSIPKQAPVPALNASFASLGIASQQNTKEAAQLLKTPAQPIAQPPPQTPHKLPAQASPRQPLPQEVAIPSIAPASPAATFPLNGHIEAHQVPGIFKSLLNGFRAAVEAGDVPKQDLITGRISSTLSQGSISPDSDAFEECLNIFAEMILKTDAVSYQSVVTVVPYINILPKLPKDYSEKAKGYLITKMLKHLTSKWPVDVDRFKFFAHAEAFAAMVQLEYVTMTGAIQTIIRLLKHQDKRSAAMTMLGKTVELCHQMVKDQCDANELSKLQQALSAVTDPFFSYDKQYIMQTMGWEEGNTGDNNDPQPLSQAPSEGPAPQPQSNGIAKRLIMTHSWGGFDAPLRALAVDDDKAQIISSTDAGGLFLHSAASGALLSKVEAAEHKYWAMDLHQGRSLVVLAGVPQAGISVAPVYVAYQLDQGALRPQGRLVRSTASDIRSLRFLFNSDQFVAAETSAGQQVVSLYDCTRIVGSGAAEPLSTYQSPQEIITAITTIRNNASVFLTAGKDGSVLLWDQRQEHTAATLTPPAMQPNSHPNANVITSLDKLGTHVLAGTYGAGIVTWDLRMLQQTREIPPHTSFKVDDKPVTRIAVRPEADQHQLAVASQENMFTLDLDADGNITSSVLGQKSSEGGVYFDIKWGQATGEPTLYCASSNRTLDIYKLV